MGEKRYTEAVSKLIAESRRVFSYEGLALEETRDVIDYQMELIKEADKETIRLIRLNLVLLGAFVPLFITSPNILNSIIPWALISVWFAVMSVGIASYVYRGWVMYGGFGDSPNLTLESLRETLDMNVEKDDISSVEDIDPVDITLADFQTLLIKDHELGILHNNVELRYRNEINQQTAILLLISLLNLVTGVFYFVSSQEMIRTILYIFTAVFVFVGIFHTMKTISLLARFELRSDDEERLNWGHAFHRSHPILSKLFITVLYIWDPKKHQ